MFLDASAIIAILDDEPEAAGFLAKIEASPTPITCSATAVFEAAIGLARIEARSLGLVDRPMPPELIDRAKRDVERFLEAVGARAIVIDLALGAAAIDAARTYGRFVGHPARLNFGDCFAYACAKGTGVPLLFKGEDFGSTDVEIA
ncbi:type II toxin-antitoxin system VapC family toxin [Methyloraptor flagellatus]|uniref:Ribonuclease VapC n=1 Tax=Methyloraptor flagellatus TaxID=3162530 RepID=A0AAU7XB12_9HYPH